MKVQKARYFAAALLILAALLSIAACKSTQPAIETVEPAQPSGPDELDTARSRAENARSQAEAVNGQEHFPDEWSKAETDYEAGNNAAAANDREGALAAFALAADEFEAITGNSIQLLLNEAIARAEQSRTDAETAQAPVYMAEEWAKAEADLQTAQEAKTDTVDDMRAAETQYSAAAGAYDSLAVQSRLLAEKNEAQKTLDTAISRAEKSRQEAEAANGQTYFPEEWENAEAANASAKEAATDTLDDIKAAAGLYGQAADMYDALTQKSGEQLAKEKEDAQKALNDAIAKADQARKNAQAAQAETFMANEWKKAESDLQTAKNAKTTTADEIKTAEAQYTAVAAVYDDLAAKSRPLAAAAATAAALAETKKTLDAAIARAEKSRQAAVASGGQTYFPNDWKNAETKITSAKAAKTGTEAEIKTAAGLYGQAADMYDALTQKSGAQLAKEREDAQKALNDAIAKADQSRKAASDAQGQTNFPDDWKNAEAKNTAARNAKKTTPAEMKAAVPLYTQAAQAYDAITQKSIARAAEENQKAAQDAKILADRERQTAMDAKAQIAVKDDFNKAEAVYQQAVTDLGAKSFTQAAGGFTQSTPMFTAAAQAAAGKQGRAEDIINQAKQKSAESITFAETSGRTMEEQNE